MVEYKLSWLYKDWIMIFGLRHIKKLKEINVITEETYNNLVKYFDNYPYAENSFSDEDRELIKAENRKGNFDIFSDKDLLTANRDGIIEENELTCILTELKNRKHDLSDDMLCFKTTPISKVLVLSMLSGGIYDIILSFNYWKTLKENCGYKVSPFWRGLFELFTNFKLFPIFSKYIKGFECKFSHPIFLAILYLICCGQINIQTPNFKLNSIVGIYAWHYNMKLSGLILNPDNEYHIYFKLLILGIAITMLLFSVIKSFIYAYIQHKINKINIAHHKNAPKNPWNVVNIIWVIILSYFVFENTSIILQILFR